MNTDEVVLNVHMEAVPGHEEELAAQLLALVQPTRNEPGCIAYELHRDPRNEGRFMFYEKFASEAALEAHRAAPHFQSFVKYRSSASPDPVAKSEATLWRAIA